MKRWVGVLSLWLSMTLGADAAEHPFVQAYISDFPPYEYKDPTTGKLTGFSLELFQAMAEEAGVSYEIKLYPWKRALKTVQHTPNSVVFSATRNKQREHQHAWVGPIASQTIKIYALKRPVKDWKLDLDFTSNASILKSIKTEQYKIGAVLGDANHDSLIEKGYTVFSSPKHGLSINQWFSGRFPLYSTNDLRLAYKLQQSGHSLSEVKEIAVFADDYSYYFMFNKKSSPELLKKLQKSLDTVKSTGLYQKIQSKWLK